MFMCGVFFFKQKTAYELRISDWSSDVCSSDLPTAPLRAVATSRSSAPLQSDPSFRARGSSVVMGFALRTNNSAMRSLTRPRETTDVTELDGGNCDDA